MQSDDFEWDDVKAETNEHKHGVTFEQATQVFGDAYALEQFDGISSIGEDRFIVIGRVPTDTGDKILYLVYTDRGERKRDHIGPKGIPT